MALMFWLIGESLGERSTGDDRGLTTEYDGLIEEYDLLRSVLVTLEEIINGV